MDYYEIGQRIRRARKAHYLSQEQLAEKVSISVTHMSHIETGSTKLSLPVLVDLAAALDVKTDELLFDSPELRIDEPYQDVAGVLACCTPPQAKVISEIVKCVKEAIDKYM